LANGWLCLSIRRMSSGGVMEPVFRPTVNFIDLGKRSELPYTGRHHEYAFDGSFDSRFTQLHFPSILSAQVYQIYIYAYNPATFTITFNNSFPYYGSLGYFSIRQQGSGFN